MKFRLKIITTIFFTFCILSYSFGQKRKIQHNPNYDSPKFHLGYSIGFPSQVFRISPSLLLLNTNEVQDTIFGLESKSSIGISLAFISDFRLGNNFSLRFQPGLILGQKNLIYKEKNFDVYIKQEFIEYNMVVPSYYIDVPIALKFKAKRINNYRPYAFVGISTKYNVDYKGVVRQNEGYTIKQEPLDYFYEFGIGIDFYLVYFKLGTELKFGYGLKDILIHETDEHAKVIERLQSHLVTLSLHFE